MAGDESQALERVRAPDPVTDLSVEGEGFLVVRLGLVRPALRQRGVPQPLDRPRDLLAEAYGAVEGRGFLEGGARGGEVAEAVGSATEEIRRVGDLGVESVMPGGVARLEQQLARVRIPSLADAAVT